MAAKDTTKDIKTAKVTEIISSAELARVQRETGELTGGLITRAAELQIETEHDYAKADSLLTGIREVSRTAPMKLDEIIKPIKAGLALLNGVRKKMMDPLAASEATVRSKMREYRVKEQGEIDRKRMEKEKEDRRIQEKAEEAERQLAAARSAAQRRVLERKLEHLGAKAIEAQSVVVEKPVVVSGSTTRTTRRVRVVDADLLIRAVADSKAPSDLITINTSVLNKMHRDNQDYTESLPGVEGYDDISIVERR